MELAFKELEGILATHFGVSDQGEAAFRGRIQHLQRAKVPAGVNTGKGRAAVYRWPQMIELMTVLDLIDVGLSPEAARRIVDYSRGKLFKLAASFACDVTDEVLLTWVAEERCPLNASRVISTSIGALHALSGGEDIIFECMTGREFANSIVDEDSYKLSSCFINISKRIMTVMNFIRVKSIYEIGPEEGPKLVIKAFRHWASTVNSVVS